MKFPVWYLFPSLFPIVLAAQLTLPAGLVRGTLLECESERGSGELSVRAASNEVFRFTFDPKTYFEREGQRTDSGHLRIGELVEIVADRNPPVALRYARTIHVLNPPAPVRPPVSAGRYRVYTNPIEHIIPTGTLTFSGVVFRVNNERLILHLREGPDKTILLRRDTRYLEGGSVVENSSLKPNMRVFVRAGKDLYDELEAYQVIWGQILQPGQP